MAEIEVSSGADETSQGLTGWQMATLGTLLVGYAGYYICRSNLSIAVTSIVGEFQGAGWDKRTLGSIASIGTLVYAFGKVSNGVLTDFVSSRLVFLLGMFASALCTVAFGLGSTFGILLAAWSCNRFVQSAGWGALVKLASRWFPTSRHGLVMGILCLSYLFGDALARLVLGFTLGLLSGDEPAAAAVASPSAPSAVAPVTILGISLMPWRWMFLLAASALTVIATVSWFLLKQSPADVGDAEPAANPNNVFGAAGNDARPLRLRDLIGPLLRNGSFWLVLYMSLGLTLVREAVMQWTPTYLTEVCQLSASRAGMASAVIPLVGGFAAILAGVMADWLAARGRGLIMFSSLALMSLSLASLAQVSADAPAWIPLTLMCSAFFFLIGPYTFLTGVISLDFGGKRGAATAAGLTDAAGYLGAVLSGRWIGGIAQDAGWTRAFGVLALAAFLTALAALAYWLWHDVRLFRAQLPPR